MNYTEILAALGISQGVLENIIIFSVIAIMVGAVAIVYLQYIVAGVFALAIIYIFAHHEPTVAKVIPETEVVSEKVVTVEPPKVNSEHDKYVKDCMSLTGKQDMCEELWNDQSQ
jgi:hypothetical protein